MKNEAPNLSRIGLNIIRSTVCAIAWNIWHMMKLRMIVLT